MKSKCFGARLAAVLAVALPSLAAAEYGPPIAISEANQESIGEPELGMNSSGTAFIVWRHRLVGFDFPIVGRTRSSAGALGPVFTISPDAGDQLQIGIGAGGGALITWSAVDSLHQLDGLRFRRVSPAGALNPVKGLTEQRRADAVQIATDANGHALFVWQADSKAANRSRIYGRVRFVDGTFGTAETLAPPEAVSPAVAMAPDGRALLAWSRRVNRDRPPFIEVRARSADLQWGPIRTVSGPGAVGPQVFLDADGDGIVVWSRPGGAEARTISAEGQLGPIESLGPAAPAKLQIVGDGDGNAIVAWQTLVPFENSAIRARAFSVAGDLGPLRDVGNGSNFDLAFDPPEGARIAWTQRGRPESVWVRPIPFAGDVEDLEPAERAYVSSLNSKPNVQRLYGPELAIDGEGRALVVWTEKVTRADGHILGAAEQ